jgi:hypothetical protein
MPGKAGKAGNAGKAGKAGTSNNHGASGIPSKPGNSGNPGTPGNPGPKMLVMGRRLACCERTAIAITETRLPITFDHFSSPSYQFLPLLRPFCPKCRTKSDRKTKTDRKLTNLPEVGVRRCYGRGGRCSPGSLWGLRKGRRAGDRAAGGPGRSTGGAVYGRGGLRAGRGSGGAVYGRGGRGGRRLSGPVDGSGSGAGGFSASIARARSTPASSCGSRPIAQSSGVIRTSVSGSTP